MTPELALVVSEWAEAFHAIKDEMTPQGLRALVAMMTPSDKDADGNDLPLNPVSIKLGVEAAKVTFANDQKAAEVAHNLVHTAHYMRPSRKVGV